MRIAKRLLRRIVPSNILFVKQIGYWYYQRRSIRRLFLHLFKDKTMFLPSYLPQNGRPLYEVHDWDPSGSEVFMTDGYADWGLERVFLSCIEPGGCLIDVGAHSGYFSHLLYEQCNQFVNIETSSRCFNECLMPMKRDWKHKDVFNINSPAFDEDNVEIEIHDSLEGYGMSKELGQALHGKSRAVKVMKSITVDSLYDQLMGLDEFRNSFVSSIKIDVDGCDSEVLRGAMNTIKRFRPVIFMESFSGKDFDLLSEFDYTIYTMRSNRSDPRFSVFVSINSAEAFNSIWYKMCIAAPSSNSLLKFFEGMTRDNHDRKHLFIDI